MPGLGLRWLSPRKIHHDKSPGVRVNHANMVGLEPSESYVLIFDLANSRGPGFTPIGPTLYSEHSDKLSPLLEVFALVSDTVYGLFPILDRVN